MADRLPVRRYGSHSLGVAVTGWHGFHGEGHDRVGVACRDADSHGPNVDAEAYALVHHQRSATPLDGVFDRRDGCGNRRRVRSAALGDVGTAAAAAAERLGGLLDEVTRRETRVASGAVGGHHYGGPLPRCEQRNDNGTGFAEACTDVERERAQQIA